MKLRGFTLIELLATIIILACILMLIYPIIDKVVIETNITADKQVRDSIVLAAKNWGSDNKDKLPEVVGDKASVDLITLQNEGYIDVVVKNPSTNKTITDVCVTIIKKENSINYEYDGECANKPVYASVTYNHKANGGNSTNAIDVPKLLKGTEVNLNYEAVKDGWIFMGWNTDKNAKTGLKNLEIGEEDITLYSIYKKPSIEYTLTTNPNGGIGSNNTYSCQIPEVYNNEVQETSCKVTLPQNTYSKSGYKFNGWSTSINGTSGTNPGIILLLTRNMTYYATWYRNEIYPSCTIDVSGTTKYAIGKYWYTSTPTITLRTTNAKSSTFTGPKNEKINTQSTKLNYDTTGGYYNGTVVSSTGNVAYCSYLIYRDTNAPKIYISIYDPTVNKCLPGLSAGQTDYTVCEYAKAENRNLNAGSYKLGKIAYRVVAVDYLDPNQYWPQAGKPYGSGLKSPVVMTYETGTANITTPNHYDFSNEKGSFRIDQPSIFSAAGSRNISFTAKDNVGNQRTTTLTVTIDK